MIWYAFQAFDEDKDQAGQPDQHPEKQCTSQDWDGFQVTILVKHAMLFILMFIHVYTCLFMLIDVY